MSEDIRTIIRRLRKNQTKSEEAFWDLVRNRRICGKKFLRQYPIFYNDKNGIKKFFIADFYCAERKLVIEIDGEIHDNQVEYNKLRTNIMNTLGINVLRIRNDEFDNKSKVIEKVKTYL